MEETRQTVDGYTCTTTSQGLQNGTVTMKEGENAVVSFLNEYAVSHHTLTIEKKVQGNMGDTTQPFTFKVTFQKDGKDWTGDIGNSAEGVQGNWNGKEYTFQLKHEQSILMEIPADITYTVVEENEDYAASYVIDEETAKTGSQYTGTLTADTKITFTNAREIAPPTGIRDNVIPFSMMLLTAAAGTVWFGLSGRRKRSA